MTEGGQSVCLCMIVRDEAHVIERCLESVRPFIDKVAICDTGSVDGTFREIYHSRALRLAGIEPTIRKDKWVNFAHNRNEALKLAEQSGADYALIIDADDWVVAPPDYRLPALTEDVYDLPFQHSNITYSRPQLIRLGRGCRWRGVLHEFLEIPPGSTRGTLPLTIHYGADGARSRDPEKFRRDAEVLKQAVIRHDEPDLLPRYVFYLAQSCRDAGELSYAMDWYQQRAAMGGWVEEVYVARYYAGCLAAQLGRPEADVTGPWKAAQAAGVGLPGRLEALVAHARYLRERNRHSEAYELLNDWRNRYLCPSQDPSYLFAETWVYRHGFWDELSVAAYWTKHYSISVDAALQALKGDPPPADRERIIKNAELALQKL